jgi:predicted DNA binding CopG/RHH family protein
MNKEEKKIAEAYDRGAVKLETPSSELLDMLASAGENTFKKDKCINIRLSSHDLVGIQRKAVQKGIPYQALISGLIHQYVEGDIQEKSSVDLGSASYCKF